jgi:hypothetical protein
MTYKKIYFSLLSVLLLIAACKKSNHNPPDVFNATIYDSSYQGASITSYLNNNVFEITTYPQNKMKELSISIPGRVLLDSPIISAAYLSYFQPVTGWFISEAPNMGHVTVTVTSWDSTTHRIAGSFSAVALGSRYDSVIITNGAFNVTYSLN